MSLSFVVSIVAFYVSLFCTAAPEFSAEWHRRRMLCDNRKLRRKHRRDCNAAVRPADDGDVNAVKLPFPDPLVLPEVPAYEWTWARGFAAASVIVGTIALLVPVGVAFATGLPL